MRDFFNPEDEDYNPIEHALFTKGMEIEEVVHNIIQLIPEDGHEILKKVADDMMSEAMMLSVKVVGAKGDVFYSHKMENAAIIRKAANDLILHEHSFRAWGFEENDYFLLVRQLVEEYRLLFVEWVEGFDQWNYLIDRWGLFNPPGVTAHDHDPDDDIPFNPDEFFDFENDDED